MLLKDYTSCSTSGLRKLDLQLIDQVNILSPGCLLNFASLQRISCGAGCHPWMQAPALDALTRAIAARSDVTFVCNSAYRTVAQQFVLYNHYLNKRCGITAAATPGRSNHNSGVAIDIEDDPGWKPYLERYGWNWMGGGDKWHFDYVEKKVPKAHIRDLRSISIMAFQQLWNFNLPAGVTKLLVDGVWSNAVNQALLMTPVAGFARIPNLDLVAIPGTLKALAVQKIIIKTVTNKSALRKGEKGLEVRELQNLLVAKGAKLKIDDDFGAATEKAVIAFQLANGLVGDGVVGAATWTELVS